MTKRTPAEEAVEEEGDDAIVRPTATSPLRTGARPVSINTISSLDSPTGSIATTKRR